MSGAAAINPDAWLGGFLKCDAWQMTADAAFVNEARDPASPTGQRLRELMGGDVFLQAKVPSADVAGCEFLEALGFRFIDASLLFDKPIESDRAVEAGPFRIGFAEADDREAVMALGGQSFIYSRFYQDPLIPREAADAFKAGWVGNFFLGRRGDALVVAKDAGGKLAGFNLLLKRNGGALIVDLIAVDKEFRRRGVATAMMAFAEANHPDRSRYLVGTQAGNMPSVRTYENYGFRLCETSYVFHYHNRTGGQE